MRSHNAVLLIGSNINPQENIPSILKNLANYVSINGQSGIYRSHSVGADGPDYLNLAVNVTTHHRFSTLKFGILRKIEEAHGRIRGEDKYAPRTADIDIVVFDGKVIDNNLWNLAFIAVPVVELLPNLLDPLSQRTLAEIVVKLKQNSWIVEYPAVS